MPAICLDFFISISSMYLKAVSLSIGVYPGAYAFTRSSTSVSLAIIFILIADVCMVLIKAPDFSYSSELTPSCSRTAVSIFLNTKLFCCICKLTIFEYLGVPIAACLSSLNYSSTRSRNRIYKMTKSLNILKYWSVSKVPFSPGLTFIGAKWSNTFLTSLY